MQINVVKIGNSKGIRIPKKVLDQCQVEDVLELTVKDNHILLEPVHKKPREGWVEAFDEAPVKSMAKSRWIQNGWMPICLPTWKWKNSNGEACTITFSSLACTVKSNQRT